MKRTAAHLRRHLRQYYMLEGYNALFFAGLAVYLGWKYGLGATLLRQYGLWLMVLILVQGTAYWWLRWRVMYRNVALTAAQLQGFRRAGRWNVALLALLPLMLVLKHYVAPATFWPDAGWGVAAWAFAGLEHINYFHWQLMYDNVHDWRWLRHHKRLKTAALRRDFRRAAL